jgi:hypothetical protein
MTLEFLQWVLGSIYDAMETTARKLISPHDALLLSPTAREPSIFDFAAV